jgi:protease-4
MTDKITGSTPDKEGWERSVLEKIALSALEEQRRARRWGIFFKLFIVAYLLLLLISVQWDSLTGHGLASRYTALVDMEGVIESEGRASADRVVTGLRAAFESAGTAGVILRVNSPGGSPVQSAYINDEISRLREQYPDTPLYAVIGDVCASGCYYVVVAADRIYANKGSIVGSIGVLMDGFGFPDAMKKLGVERRLLTAGENKAMFDPFSPVNAKDRRYLQGMLNEVHQQFIDVVKDGRGDSLKASREIFSGLIWTGERAKALGLVDDFGSASFVAREVIGAEDIVDFTAKENILDRFAQQVGATAASVLRDQLLPTTMR